MTPDLLPAVSAIGHVHSGDELAANAAHDKQLSYRGIMPKMGHFGSQMLGLGGSFDYLGSSALSGLMTSYAEEPIYGPMVVKCTHEIEQEIAPTSKMAAGMIVQLSSMPSIVNSLKQFKVVDDQPSASGMIASHIPVHWPNLFEGLVGSHDTGFQKPDMPWLASVEQLVAQSFEEQILMAQDPTGSLRTLAQLRELLARAVTRYEQLDHAARLERLRETAAALGKREPLDLLTSLADERGLSWQTISTMLGVSSSAVRKWRRGTNVAPENREQIAALVAFFDQTDEIREPIADVGSWMEMRVREDTALTPALIYAHGSEQRWLLLEWMRGYVDATMMLDRFDESWRERYARDPNFHVVETEVGERAIVPR